ncbi:MAG: WD40/YVTN/BNR-like repeat-containing protein [Gammaproteobacteria bacterium]
MRISRSPWQAVAVSGLVAISGCEAPLVLDHVEAQRGATTQRYDLFQATATNGNTIVVVGSGGVVLTSADSGTTWSRSQLAGAPFLLDVAACPDDRFVALAAKRQVWIGDAAGQAWSAAPLDTFEALQAVTCDPRGRIWVVGSFSTLWRSDDFGASWTETSLNEDLHLTTIQFVDERTGFMTGEFGVIVRSRDGGESWENLVPLADEFYPQAAHFGDAETGWIVGLNGTIWATADGGASWSQQQSGTSAPLYGIAANGPGLFAVGGFGTVLAATPSGAWRRIDHGLPIRFYLRGVLPLDNHRILTVGGAGALFVIDT